VLQTLGIFVSCTAKSDPNIMMMMFMNLICNTIFHTEILMHKYIKSLKLHKKNENIFKGIFLLCRFIKFLKGIR